MKLLYLLMLIVGLINYPAISQWEKLPGPSGCTFQNIAVTNGFIWAKYEDKIYTSPTDSIYWTKRQDYSLPPLNSIYCEGEKMYAATAEGVFLSTDVGDSWKHVYENIPSENIERILIRGDFIYIIGNYDKLYRSNDAGKTWSKIQNDKFVEIEDIAASVSGDTKLVAKGGAKGLCISFDRGITWMLNLASAEYDDNDPNIYNVYINDSLYIATTDYGMYYSLDFGKTWKNSASSYPIKKIVFDDELVIAQGESVGVLIFKIQNGELKIINNPHGISSINDIEADNSRIYVASFDRFFVSSDSGRVWNNYTEGTNGIFLNSIIDYQGSILTAGYKTGLYISNDEGIKWTEHPFDTYITNFQKISSLDSVLFGILTFQNRLLVSFDRGVNWNAFYNELSNVKVNDVLPLKKHCLAATSAGIYISEDTCKAWRSADTALSQYSFDYFGKTNKSIIASSNDRVLISYDDGLSWEKIDYYFEQTKMRGIEADDSVVVLFNLEGYIYVSSDCGETWKTMNQPFLPVSAMAVKGKNLFAKSHDNIYLSTDLGATWKGIGGKVFNNAPAYDFMIKDSYIYAVSYGVFRAKLSDFGIINSVNEAYNNAVDLSLFVHPNPATEFININNVSEPFTIEIYNSLGERVVSAANTKSINVATLATGNYFITVTCGDIFKTSKFIILK